MAKTTIMSLCQERYMKNLSGSDFEVNGACARRHPSRDVSFSDFKNAYLCIMGKAWEPRLHYTYV